MAERKAPTPVDHGQVKPEPPPAPPAVNRPTAVLMAFIKGFKAGERKAEARCADLLAALKAADAAINPRDRGGISLHVWNERLKAASAAISAAIAKHEGR